MKRVRPPTRTHLGFWAHAPERLIALLLAAVVLGVLSIAPVSADMTIYEDEFGKLDARLRAGAAAFGTSNSWFGNSRRVIGSDPDFWFEAFTEFGLAGTANLLGGELYGAATGVYTGQRQEDPRGNNSNDIVNVEKLFLGWRYDKGIPTGIPSLDIDAIDLSVGRQEYKIGSGFLIWDGTFRRRDNVGFQFDPRQVWQLAGIGRMDIGPLKIEGFYLNPEAENDYRRMTVEAKGWGVNAEYDLGDYGSMGATAGHVFDGDGLPIREGGNVFNMRANVTPLKSLPGLSFYGEFAYEENGNRAEALGYALQGGYRAQQWWGSPAVAYRYAYFSGDDPDTKNRDEAFDPLAYGGSDWGTWFQGEIIGHYVLLNTNLKTHMVRFDLKPLESVMTGIQYYKFELDHAKSFGATASSFAQELDVTATWFIDKRFRITVVSGVARPQQAAKQLTGGDKDWFIGKLFLNFQL